MRTTLVGLFTMLVAACSVPTDPSTPEYWIHQLDNPQKRIEALAELGKLGDQAALPHVLKWFQEKGEWQPTAAFTLGQLGDLSVAKDLVGAIDYQVGSGRDRTTVRKNRINQNVARALAMLKAPEGVDPLVNLLKTGELKTKEQVIRALGRIGDPRATKHLVAIADTDRQPFIRKTAIQALGDLGDPAAVDVIIKNLYTELPGVSFYNESRYSLQQIGAPAIPKLIETLARKNQDVEAIRIQGGGKIAEGAVEAKAAFVIGALKAKEGEDLMITALEKFYGQFANRHQGGVFASVPGAVMELCYALGNIGSQKATPLLRKVATDEEPNVRVAATEALTTIGDTAAVSTLLGAAKKGPRAARRHAIEAASRLGGGSDLPAYDALARAGDKTVKAAAMEKMVKASRPRLEAAKECSQDLSCWKGKLGDKQAIVRERAAYQLGWQRAKDLIPDLVKVLEDDDAAVRMAAVMALRQFDDAVEAEPLQAIHDKYERKIDYRNVNAEMRRLIARLRALDRAKK